MRTYPGLLTNAVRSALRSKHDLMLENLALRQQFAVLTRQRARTRCMRSLVIARGMIPRRATRTGRASGSTTPGRDSDVSVARRQVEAR